jgi:phosphoserine phosphatase RsbU/P
VDGSVLITAGTFPGPGQKASGLSPASFGDAGGFNLIAQRQRGRYTVWKFGLIPAQPLPSGHVKPGIRTKFIGILVLATVLPLLIAASAVYLLGDRYYRSSSGRIFQSRAQQMANYLILSVNGHTESLHDWVALSSIYDRLQAINADLPEGEPTAEHLERLHEWQAEWLRAEPGSELLQSVTQNDLAEKLSQYRDLSPLFAEIFVTDRHGRMVATTGKTTNFYHGDRTWWQRGMEKGFRSAYVEGVNFDESTGVYSFDLIIPIRNRHNPESPPAGVIKGVIDASPLFFELARMFSRDEAEWMVVLDDGDVLFAQDFRPLEQNILPQARQVFEEERTGWMVRRLNTETPQMAGFARLPWPSNLGGNGADGHLYVLVHLPAGTVFAPVRQQLITIVVGGFLLMLLFFLVGLYLAQYHIIDRINLIQVAAQRIASSAKLDQGKKTPEPAPSLEPVTVQLLQRIATIAPDDEIGELARDFTAMAERVLSYHAHLEAEITAKVADIQGDLLIAREFQEALMTHEYPQLDPGHAAGGITLHFNHIYKPASTVGGDFFNVVKLSEDRAGIFIADVMGHGSRSALVTAIVATLLHDLAPKSSDPAEFMTVLNQHFHHLIQHSKQVIFVTAFYLVIDTRERRALYASAGHPSPILVQRAKSRVKPLIHSMQNDTALGLLDDSTYACFSSPIAPGDMFLLFTDGLFEVINPKGEEFGMTKLLEVINRNMETGASEMSQKILDTLNRYSGFAAQADDMCLVSVEVESGASPTVAGADER